jgi:hypothetical protein
MNIFKECHHIKIYLVLKKKYFILLFTCLLFNAHAQTSSRDTSATSKAGLQQDLLSLSFLLPGLTYERALNNHISLSATAGLTFAAGDDGVSESNFDLIPFGNLSGRYYYNLEERQKKGKSILYNSGNYLALSVVYQTGVLSPDWPDKLDQKQSYLSAGPVWGFQRTFKDNFHINIDLGFGYYKAKSPVTDFYYNPNNNEIVSNGYYLKDSSGMTLIGNIRFGIILNKNKK